MTKKNVKTVAKYTHDDAVKDITEKLEQTKTLALLILETQMNQSKRVDHVVQSRDYYAHNLKVELTVNEVFERVEKENKIRDEIKEVIEGLKVDTFLAKEYKDPFSDLIPKCSEEDTWIQIYDKKLVFDIIADFGSRFEQLFHDASDKLFSVTE